MNFIDWETAKSIALILFILILGVVAFRINIKFDVNEYTKRRDANRKTRLMNLCPHTELFKEEDKYYFKSLFASPPGTTNWICERCGLTTYQNEGECFAKMWEKDFKKFKSRSDAFIKLAKKMGIA